MKRTLLGAAALSCLVAWQIQAADDKKPDKTDKDKIQGKWEIVSVEIGGMKIDPPKEKSTVFTFDGDKLKVQEGDQKAEEGTFKFDETKKVREIDMTMPKGGNDKEKITIKGIYQLDGDTFKFAWSSKGADGDRPTGFDGKECLVMTLKRKK